MKEKKECIICGFNKRVHIHHIIKRVECGSDDEENLVYLCLNHHWIADFGEPEDRREILEIIKNLTGKIGKKISNEEQQILDLKIRVLNEDGWNQKFDEEFWKEFKETSNYDVTKAWLLGIRGCPKNISTMMNEKAEKLILINKLKESLPNF